MADELTEALDFLSVRIDAARTTPEAFNLDVLLGEAGRALAALAAVLKPHRPGRTAIAGELCPNHEAHRFFSIDQTEAADIKACPDCSATVYITCTGCDNWLSLERCPIRWVISRELLGTKEERSAGG